MSVKIFVDGKVFAEIRVNTVELGGNFSPDIFDVDRILGSLPHADDGTHGKSGHQDRVHALDRELEEFNKLYD